MTTTTALTIVILALVLLWVYTIAYALHYTATLKNRLLASVLPEAAKLIADQATGDRGRHANNN